MFDDSTITQSGEKINENASQSRQLTSCLIIPNADGLGVVFYGNRRCCVRKFFGGMDGIYKGIFVDGCVGWVRAPNVNEWGGG